MRMGGNDGGGTMTSQGAFGPKIGRDHDPKIDRTATMHASALRAGGTAPCPRAARACCSDYGIRLLITKGSITHKLLPRDNMYIRSMLAQFHLPTDIIIMRSCHQRYGDN